MNLGYNIAEKFGHGVNLGKGLGHRVKGSQFFNPGFQSFPGFGIELFVLIGKLLDFLTHILKGNGQRADFIGSFFHRHFF